MRPGPCCVLNAGGGAWAFEALARRLADDLWVDVADTPRAYNYVLSSDDSDPVHGGGSFVPLDAVRAAADKRVLARVFAAHAVPIPETYLLDRMDDAHRLRAANPDRAWCVKYPTACGGWRGGGWWRSRSGRGWPSRPSGTSARPARRW